MLRKFMILLVALSAAVMLPLSASAEIKEGVLN